MFSPMARIVLIGAPDFSLDFSRAQIELSLSKR